MPQHLVSSINDQMEPVTTTPTDRVTADADVVAHELVANLQGGNPPPPAPQSLEWIPHGDASARRRARAHITRAFRRQKATEAKESQEKEREKGKGKEKEKTKAKKKGVREESSQGTQAYDPSNAGFESYETTGHAGQELSLYPTLGSGRGDPFKVLPVDLRPGGPALLDHFLSGVAPISYQRDSRSNFNHIKFLGFEVALSSPPAFHAILSAAASDIAALHGRQYSKEAAMHQGMAISSVSSSLAKLDRGARVRAEDISAVALLAGNELLTGDPKTFNTHMDGLASVVGTWGGLESMRESKPQLYSIISSFDFAGACNLLSKRRFMPSVTGPSLSPTISSSSSSSSPPPGSPMSSTGSQSSLISAFGSLSLDYHGVPPTILSSLPQRYDLRQFICSTFYTLETLTQLPRTTPSTTFPNQPQTAPPSSAAAITATIDSELYRSICLPDQEGNRSRRRYVIQAYQTLVLLYSAFLPHLIPTSPGLIQSFCAQLESTMHGQSLGCGVWGTAVASLCKSILLSGGATDLLNVEIDRVLDQSAVLDWEEWRSIKRSLLDFLLNNELCDGRVQGVWKRRLPQGFVVIEKNLIA